MFRLLKNLMESTYRVAGKYSTTLTRTVILQSVKFNIKKLRFLAVSALTYRGLELRSVWTLLFEAWDGDEMGAPFLCICCLNV